MSTGRLLEAVTDKTAAIIPVHLYGQAANMMPIFQLVEDKEVVIIEDCAQAHMSEYGACSVGSLGEIGCFSFYPAKNLGAFGEAGALVTSNEQIYEKCLALRNHGRASHTDHQVLGYNYRMDALQAAILNVKMQYLAEWTQKRRQVAEWYQKELAGINEIKLPYEAPYGKHVYHLFVIQAERRGELVNHLDSYGISTGIHYPKPLHLQPACERFGYKEGDFPVAEKAAKNILSLPMYPGLKGEQVALISHHIRTFYRI
jgi:dTDP-4-amino-4,6-dideoxygalactose transaminase